MLSRTLARLSLATVLACGAAAAQAPASATDPYSWSFTPLYQFDAGMGSGGDAGYTAFLATVGRNWSLDNRSSLGFTLRLDYEDWRFSNVQGFGGVAPWDRIYRPSIAVTYARVTEGGWRWSITPSIEFSGESGARFSDALIYGATGSVAKQLRPNLTLGLGAGVFYRLEETRVFPFLVVDWRITDRWRLSNPFVAGPAGPAGLELSYALGGGWEAGVGAAYRSFRQRLDENGAFPNGIGEYRFVPVFARVGRKVSDTFSVDFYAAATTGAKLRVEDSGGNGLYNESLDTSALVGLALRGRF